MGTSRGGSGKDDSAWKMSESDVVGGFESSNGGGPDGSGGFSRKSRKSSTTSSTVTLIHKPTGLKVVGAVPAGHYSRAEMIKKRSQLRAELWTLLEMEVSQALRIPGR